MAVTMSKKVVARPFVSSGVTPAAPAVPAAPAPPRPTFNPGVLPPDATYDQTLAGLSRQRDVTLAGLATQKQQGLLNYGYTQDQSGGLAFDPTNPYSQAAILKRNYDQSRASSGISLAARGQLYSGAYQNAQDYANRQELQSSDALQKQLMAFLSQNTQAGAQAGVAYEQGVGQAGGDRISRALELYRMMLGG